MRTFAWVLLQSALGIAVAAQAAASPLVLSIPISSMVAAPGSDVIFDGTVGNFSGADIVDFSLNFANFNPAVVSLTEGVDVANLALDDQTTSGVLSLLTFHLGANAVPGMTYFADVTVEDNDFGNLSNTVTVSVTAPAAAVPEPSSAALVALAFGLLALGFRRRFSWLSIVAVAAVLPAVGSAQVSPVNFSTGVTGVAILRSGTAMLHLPLINFGSASASGVTITSATLGNSATLTALPMSMGDLAAGAVTSVPLAFSNSNLSFGNTYAFVVQGAYTYNGVNYGFQVNQNLLYPDPGTPDNSTEGYNGTVSSQSTNGPYDPGPVSTIPDLDDANPTSTIPDIPVGPSRGQGTFSPPTNIESVPAIGSQVRLRPQADTDNVIYAANTAYGNSIAAALQVNPPEPSIAKAGNVILVTGNVYGGLSTDGGQTFRSLDPRTIFPETTGNPPQLIDGGLCCDQMTLYAASVDRIVWLMQFSERNGVNRYRLAVASPADIRANINTAWRYWDLDSAFFGLGVKWMDRPDLVLGRNHLYFNFTVIENVDGQQPFRNKLTVRIPLADLAAGGVINVFWYIENNVTAFFAKLADNGGPDAFSLYHLDTSDLRLLQLPDTDGAVQIRALKMVRAWVGGNCQSLTPDNVNWLGAISLHTVFGGTRRLTAHEVWFAWPSCSDTVYTQPHIVLVKINDQTFRMTESRIWNPGYAWWFPTLATNSNEEVGMAFMVGGGGGYPNFGAGILTGTEHFPVGTAGSGASTRSGDYISVRGDGALFAAVGYTIIKINAGAVCGNAGNLLPDCRFDPHYVSYGRSSDVR